MQRSSENSGSPLLRVIGKTLLPAQAGNSGREEFISTVTPVETGICSGDSKIPASAGRLYRKLCALCGEKFRTFATAEVTGGRTGKGKSSPKDQPSPKH